MALRLPRPLSEQDLALFISHGFCFLQCMPIGLDDGRPGFDRFEPALEMALASSKDRSLLRGLDRFFILPLWARCHFLLDFLGDQE